MVSMELYKDLLATQIPAFLLIYNYLLHYLLPPYFTLSLFVPLAVPNLHLTMLRGRHQAARNQSNLNLQSQGAPDLEAFRSQWNLEIASRYPGRPMASSTLPASQTTIITALNGGLTIRPIRPGPLPKPRSLPVLPIQRQMAGGPQERSVINLFAIIHSQQRFPQLNDEGEVLPTLSANSTYVKQNSKPSNTLSTPGFRNLIVPWSQSQSIKLLGTSVLLLSCSRTGLVMNC
jgi:hypothetical protein